MRLSISISHHVPVIVQEVSLVNALHGNLFESYIAQN